VSVAESASTSIEYAINNAITSAQWSGADAASAMPADADANITIRIQRPRPIRSAISFPRIDAGTDATLTTAAIVVALHGNVLPATWKPAQNARNATIHEREPSNSSECAVYPSVYPSDARAPSTRR